MDLGYSLRFIIWLFLGGLLISRLSTRQRIRVLGEKRERWSTTAAILLVIPLIYWCATRSLWVGDTSAYYDSFAKAPSSLAGISDYVDSYTKDKTFYAFGALIKCIFGSDARVYFGIV